MLKTIKIYSFKVSKFGKKIIMPKPGCIFNKKLKTDSYLE